MLKLFKSLISVLNVFNPTDVKVLASAVGGSLAAFFSSFSQDVLGISGGFAITLAILILADFITGMAASVKENKPITSSKGVRTVFKTGAYMLFLYVAFMLQKEIRPDEALYFFNAVKYFHIYLIAHISFWEMFSVDENLKRLGIDLGLSSFLKGIINKIRSIGNGSSK